MKDYNNCISYRPYLNAKQELTIKCHKHYCLCEDKFVWDSELNSKYQTAKEENKAKNGIFLIK